MKTISLYQRRMLAQRWDGKMSLFSKLHIVDQFIEESLILEKIDYQVVLFKD